MSKHTRQQKIEALGRVIDTLDELRVKCPWDRKQTNESLRANTIEEVYELSQALLAGKPEEVRKELGDVLLHVFFYAKIGEEKAEFDIADVADALNSKLIFRHPHVFGDAAAADAQAVAENWEQIKLKEKDGNKTVLGGVPAALPSLIKAGRVQEKAANVGFDWEEAHQVWDKVSEELSEVCHAVENESQDRIEEEFGDLLFSVINAARKYNVNPDNALERANSKFIRRFNYVEEHAKQAGINLRDMTLAQMDALWNEAKTTGL